jgi:hypothetical protein
MEVATLALALRKNFKKFRIKNFRWEVNYIPVSEGLIRKKLHVLCHLKWRGLSEDGNMALTK